MSDDSRDEWRHTTIGPPVSSDLQRRIVELAEASTTPEADWIAKVDAAPVEVVAGAILHWRGHTGISVGPDPDSSRREAALAMLQGRFARQAARLAWAINLLTLMLLGATLVLIWIGIATYRGH